MRVSELRELSDAELEDREHELAQQLFALRLQKVTGQIESPARISQVRREIARVLTLLRERELKSII